MIYCRDGRLLSEGRWRGEIPTPEENWGDWYRAETKYVPKDIG